MGDKKSKRDINVLLQDLTEGWRQISSIYDCVSNIDFSKISFRAQAFMAMLFLVLALIGLIVEKYSRKPLPCSSLVDQGNPNILRCFEADSMLLPLARNCSTIEHLPCTCQDFICSAPSSCRLQMTESECNCGRCNFCDECICQHSYGPAKHHICLNRKYTPGTWLGTAIIVCYVICGFFLSIVIIKMVMKYTRFLPCYQTEKEEPTPSALSELISFLTPIVQAFLQYQQSTPNTVATPIGNMDTATSYTQNDRQMEMIMLSAQLVQELNNLKKGRSKDGQPSDLTPICNIASSMITTVQNARRDRRISTLDTRVNIEIDDLAPTPKQDGERLSLSQAPPGHSRTSSLNPLSPNITLPEGVKTFLSDRRASIGRVVSNVINKPEDPRGTDSPTLSNPP